MNLHLGFVLESVVAVLLVISIGYSILIDRRLKNLRLGEEELKKTIAELGTATDRAERAVLALRQAIEQCDGELAEQLKKAERRSSELEIQVEAGADILARIGRIVGLGESKLAA